MRRSFTRKEFNTVLGTEAIFEKVFILTYLKNHTNVEAVDTIRNKISSFVRHTAKASSLRDRNLIPTSK